MSKKKNVTCLKQNVMCFIMSPRYRLMRLIFHNVPMLQVDEAGGVGYHTPEQVMMGLRGVNRALTDAEEEYIYRILELTGYSITNGADFKLFAITAALSQKITMLE